MRHASSSQRQDLGLLPSFYKAYVLPSSLVSRSFILQEQLIQRHRCRMRHRDSEALVLGAFDSRGVIPWEIVGFVCLMSTSKTLVYSLSINENMCLLSSYASNSLRFIGLQVRVGCHQINCGRVAGYVSRGAALSSSDGQFGSRFRSKKASNIRRSTREEAARRLHINGG